MSNNPLVTIFMMTYNQEKYVRDAVRGLLSQTYEPLEILISDDCSTDRTWDIVNEEVDKYKVSGGIHKNIVLNRNKKNLGIALHCDITSKMKHGVLTVLNAGDDISFPNRVSRIVEEWIKDGCSALIVYSNARIIDEQGRDLGSLPRRYMIEGSLGAVATYSQELNRLFLPITEKGAHEDVVYWRRCELLGSKRLYVNEELMKYRVGCGVSTVLKHWRLPNLATFLAMAPAARQGLKDVKCIKFRLTSEQYNRFCEKMHNEIRDSSYHVQLLSDKSFTKRWHAYRKIHYKPFFRPGGIFQLLCLLPQRIGDPVLDILARVVRFIKGGW